MKITTLVEHPDGTATLTADLTDNELLFVAEYGLNMLLRQGYQVVDKTKTTLVAEPEGMQ